MIDIGSGNNYPANALSNFAPHQFIIDNVNCNSMEGFLQSLKFKDIEMQKNVCTLVGKAAKFKGKRKKWWITQTLYWQGEEFKRNSQEYQELLDKAYDCLFENNSFRKALLSTRGATLSHSIGKNKINETVLTEKEFIGQLKRLYNKENI